MPSTDLRTYPKEVSLTRGMFKAAHTALIDPRLTDTAEARQEGNR